MARVRRCHSCGHNNAPTVDYCVVCKLALYDPPIEESEITDAPTAPVAEPVESNPLASFMAKAAEPRFAVVFPWGEVKINVHLGIGRDESFSAVAAQLQEYPFVSNRHAELWVDGAHLRLRHLSRSNPTYVNGIDCKDVWHLPLNDRDQVDFSNTLSTRVKGPSQ